MQTAFQTTSPAAIAATSGTATPPANMAVALALADTRIPVYPCAPNKRPLIAGGYKAATTDAATITAWFNRWPLALVAIPTGPASGLWVLDVDGPAGRQSLRVLLVKLGLEQIADLSHVIVRTPSRGLHIYFSLRPGEAPRSRASDIRLGLDTRGIGGGIIAPGNVLPDGRSYRLIDASDLSELDFSPAALFDAPIAPRGLLYLATFNDRDRGLISCTPALREAIRYSEPGDWPAIVQSRRETEAAKISERIGPCEDAEGYRAQARSDLTHTAAEFSALTDGRRTGLFRTACRIGKYVAHGHLTNGEFRSAFLEAARTNGALQKHGPQWAATALRSAIEKSQPDGLPPLAREFRKNKGDRS